VLKGGGNEEEGGAKGGPANIPKKHEFNGDSPAMFTSFFGKEGDDDLENGGPRACEGGRVFHQGKKEINLRV